MEDIVCFSFLWASPPSNIRCLSIRSRAVWALSEAGGDDAGRADDCSWRAAAAGHGTGLPVLERPAGSWGRTADTVPQLRVRVWSLWLKSEAFSFDWCVGSFAGLYWSRAPHHPEPFSSWRNASGPLCLRSPLPVRPLFQDKLPFQFNNQINRDYRKITGNEFQVLKRMEESWIKN